MDHGPFGDPALVAVDPARLRELTHRYVQYRRSLTTPTGPLKTPGPDGDVLEAVRLVITGPVRPRAHPWAAGTGGRE